nr:hypothetical protein [Legionella jordanis]
MASARFIKRGSSITDEFVGWVITASITGGFTWVLDVADTVIGIVVASKANTVVSIGLRNFLFFCLIPDINPPLPGILNRSIGHYLKAIYMIKI